MEIHPDDIILFGLSFVTFLAIIVSLKFSKLFAYFSLGLFLFYTTYLYYGLLYLATQGDALVWWSFAMAITTVQLLATVIYSGVSLWKNRR